MEWKLIFRDDGILEIKSHGRYTIRDFLKMIEQIVMNPKYKPGMDTIADFRDVDVMNVNVNDIYQTKDIHVQFSDMTGTGKIAAIFSSDIGYDLSRSYEEISNMHVKSKMKTFRNFENGLEWILGRECREN